MEKSRFTGEQILGILAARGRCEREMLKAVIAKMAQIA